MSEVLLTIWRNRRWVAYGVLSVIIVFLYVANKGLHADIANAKSLNTTLQSKIETQNSQIETMAALAAQRQMAAKAALKAAEATANGHSSKASRILTLKPKGDDECAAALELLKEYQQ